MVAECCISKGMRGGGTRGGLAGGAALAATCVFNFKGKFFDEAGEQYATCRARGVRWTASS